MVIEPSAFFCARRKNTLQLYHYNDIVEIRTEVREGGSMQLYHGSSVIIKMPEYGKGNLHNDYGRGFYCTESLELAKEWACPEARDGFANAYELDLRGLQILDLQDENYHILNWIALLLQNRVFVKRAPIAREAERYLLAEFLPDTSGYDIICGYRADDSYFSYAKDFLNNTITVGQLAQAMKLGQLGRQVVLVSEEAFSKLQYVGYEKADAGIYYTKRMQRERIARYTYSNGQERSVDESVYGLFVADLMRKGVKNDDACLR